MVVAVPFGFITLERPTGDAMHRRPCLAIAALSVLLAGCGSSGSADAPASSAETASADDVRPGISAEDCDNPDAALTQAEWTHFCADPAPESDEGSEISSLELTNGEPKTFAGGEVVTVTVEPWTPPSELGGYPTSPDALDDTYARITTQVVNQREVPIEISTMVIGGKYTPSGQSWEWSLGWETRTAEGPIQPGQTGVHEEIYTAPEGDPGKEMFLTVITPRLAGEAELDRSDVPESYNLHVILP